ncbi:MAG: methyltransferase domain-containing protein [Aeromonas sp.]
MKNKIIIAVYGTGSLFRSFESEIFHRFNVVGFIQSEINEGSQNKINGLPIVSINEIDKLGFFDGVIIASQYKAEIINSLKESGNKKYIECDVLKQYKNIVLDDFEHHEYECPICGYAGHFTCFRERIDCQCVVCGSLERHRSLWLSIEILKEKYNMELSGNVLHFAPETCLEGKLKELFNVYKSADFMRNDVDLNIDMQKILLPDNSFEFVVASHVLEHIKYDSAALSEVNRILKNNGVAILPVPINPQLDNTLEYDSPDPLQDYHVRMPGNDYYDRYQEHFRQVVKLDLMLELGELKFNRYNLSDKVFPICIK